MALRRGRPPKYDQGVILEFLKSHADEIFHTIEGKITIAVKSNNIWNELASSDEAAELGLNLTGHKLYTYVVNNQGDFRRSFIESRYVEQVVSPPALNESLQNSTVNSSLNESRETSCDADINIMSIPQTEFGNIIERRIVNGRPDRRGDRQQRDIYRLVSYRWPGVINEWYRRHNPDSTCSFKFDNHWLCENFTGVMKGRCSCDIEYKGEIDNFLSNNVLITNSITVKITGRKCGIDYLRGDKRKDMAKKMVDQNKLPSVMEALDAENVRKNYEIQLHCTVQGFYPMQKVNISADSILTNAHFVLYNYYLSMTTKKK